MFEFGFTEEQKMLREMVRDFTNNEIKPISAKIDEEVTIPKNLIKQLNWVFWEFPFPKNMEEAVLVRLVIVLHRKK